MKGGLVCKNELGRLFIYRGMIMLEAYPDVLTVDDVRKILNVGRTKAYKLIESGQINSLKIGRAIRIPKQFLIDYILGIRYNDAEVDRRRYCEGG